MKSASLLMALLVFLGVSLQAQSTTTVEKNAKRITITTTKTDENGKPVTEAWVAEGEQPEDILKNMAVSPEIMQKITVDQLTTAKEGERLFVIRRAGHQASIEGRLEDVPADGISKDSEDEDVVIWTKGDHTGGQSFKVANWYGKAGDFPWAYNGERKSNCAALGVYVNTTGDQSGCLIGSLIGKGGAEEAGLVAGDIITRLDDYVVTDFPTLYDALSHYLPGEDVKVQYFHEGKPETVKVHLKSWADLPGHEWRARGDCGRVEDFKEETVEPQLEPAPNGPVGIEPLQLQDASMYPNPTQGKFTLSFTSEPGPVSITITDTDGKVLYSENNDNATGQYKGDIDINHAPPGNYVISIKQGDKVYNQQLSKQ
jgi:hypothetical protein